MLRHVGRSAQSNHPLYCVWELVSVRHYSRQQRCYQQASKFKMNVKDQLNATQLARAGTAMESCS